MPTNTPDTTTRQAPARGVDRRELMKLTGAGMAAFGAMSLATPPFAKAQDMSNGANNFYVSDRVTAEKVMFNSQYQWKVAGNLFGPKSLARNARHPALVVGHPMGAEGAEREPLRHQNGRAGLCRPIDRPAVLG